MRIALISPLYESVPPRLYGGTERIVAYLADALVELGHHVTLFATGDARTKAHLVPVRDRAIRLDPSPLKSDLAAHLSMLDEVRNRADEFDILHFHVDLIHFPIFENIAERTVTTLHGRLDLKDLPRIYRCWPEFALVSISDAQRAFLPEANWAGTVHHGMPADLLRLSERPRGGYLAFLGRISPEKGPVRAVEIARATGRPLKIAAKVDPADAAYYEKVVRPVLDHPLIDFVGEIGDRDKSAFLGNASCVLFPIDWPEPFGIVLIEAMACGTPVVAWNRGSVPEVVDHGVTGFVVSSEKEAIEAVERAGTLDRRRIRAVFERRFTAPTMARNYLDIYSRLLRRGQRLQATGSAFLQ